MEELTNQVMSIVRDVWRHRALAMFVAWVLLPIGTIVVYMQKDVFEASAIIFVDTESQLRLLLDDQIVESDLEEKIKIVRQTLLGRTQLERVGRETGLILDGDGGEQISQVIGYLSSAIRVVSSSDQIRRRRNSQSSDTFTITFQHTDRDTSVEVVDTLLSIFVSDTIATKQYSSNVAATFLEQQIADYELRLEKADVNLAEFKRINFDRLPSTQGDYFARLRTANSELESTDQALRIARSRLATIESQLQGDLSTSELSLGENTIVARVSVSEARLDELRLKYTDQHPEVVSQIALVESLRQRLQTRIDAIASSSSIGASSNPVIQALQISKNEVMTEISRLETEREHEQAVALALEASINEIPQVEAELLKLNRDYDVISSHYQELLNSLERDKLTRGVVETESVDFQMIQPPSADIDPIAPNRVVMHLAVLLASLGAGFGTAFLLGQLRPVFKSTDELNARISFPVYGLVSDLSIHSNGSVASAGVFYFMGLAILLAAGLGIAWLEFIGLGFRL